MGIEGQGNGMDPAGISGKSHGGSLPGIYSKVKRRFLVIEGGGGSTYFPSLSTKTVYQEEN